MSGYMIQVTNREELFRKIRNAVKDEAYTHGTLCLTCRDGRKRLPTMFDFEAWLLSETGEKDEEVLRGGER